MKPLFFSLLALCGLLSVSSAHGTVDYRIDLSEPVHHLARVSVTFPKTEDTELVVNLPVWRSGKYKVLPIADGVRQFSAHDSQGKPLGWKRSASGEWRVQLDAPTRVIVSYQLYGNELELRTRHIDETHAFLDASSVFVYSPVFRGEDLRVQLKVPKGWKSYSGMMRGDSEHSFVASDYDVLVDSPIETGISHHRAFKSDGRDYELVIWGEGNYDPDQMVRDLTLLSGQAKVLWDDYPFERYLFIVHATGGAAGATEHSNSTVIQLPRFGFRERGDYLLFLATASHEFIHTWNVKAYRPAGLVPYDYQSENMSELLWLAEGSTSYFENQLLLRAGVISAGEFFTDLARNIEVNRHTPGRELQSVAEASLGQWVATGGDYAVNHSVNIYSEGYMVSLALDFELLRDSGLKHSFRDVHRELQRQHSLPQGYGVFEVKTLLAKFGGKSYDAWWQTHVDSPVSLDFDALLARAGLRLNHGDEVDQEKISTQVFAGMTLAAEPGSLVLEQVLRDGPAWQAGVVAGDELVAIEGLRVSAGGLGKRLEDFRVGDTVALTLFSNDRLKQVNLVLGEQKRGALKIVPQPKASKAQKAFFTAWLGIDWPFDAADRFGDIR
jgi:predicted metalloprotease with PDZ domain